MPLTIPKPQSASARRFSTPPTFWPSIASWDRARNAAPRHAQIRWFVVPKFRNYLIFYQPYQETIMVVRVLQAAQDWTRYFRASQDPPA